MEQTSNCERIVHLVHGTFAHETEWIHPDSSLAKRVKASLGTETDVAPFNWSGDNSHSARRVAGDRLALKIRDFDRENPGKPQYIIAHSHGGNVASYALSDAEVSSKVTAVVCLGTPFIKAHARDLTGAQRLVRWVLIAGMLAVLIVTIAIVIAGIRLGFDPEFHKSLLKVRPALPEDFINSSLFPIYMIFTFFLVAGGVGWLFSRPLFWLWRFTNRKGLPGLAAAQADIIERLNAKFGNTPVLVVDTKGDEAAWWLALMSRIASFSYKILRPSRFTVMGMLILCALAGLPLLIEASQNSQTLSFLLFLLIIPILLFVTSTTILASLGWLLCLIWPAFFRSHPLGFGRDDFLQSFIVEISSNEIPEKSTRLHQETITVKGKGLRHSRLYQEEDVLGILDKWLKELLD